MTLATAIEDARAALVEAPAGELTLGLREIVWAQLGPRGGRPGAPLPGRIRRAELARRSCERVIGLWEQERPGDDQPREVLEVARLALFGEIAESAAKTAAGALWGRTENLTQIVGDPDRLSIGFACAKAVDVALYDEVFDPDDLDPARESLGLDLFEVDAAFLAASAVAGGPPWRSYADAERRREFWTWWITEAVPAVAGRPG